MRAWIRKGFVYGYLRYDRLAHFASVWVFLVVETSEEPYSGYEGLIDADHER